MVGMPPPKKASPWSVTLENAERFEAAMRNVPMQQVFQELSWQAIKHAKKLITQRPQPMGATPGSKGKSSSGNTPTPGRTFWKRGIGAFREPKQVDTQGMDWRKGLNATRPVRRRGAPVRSEKLQGSWRSRANINGKEMALFSEVTYAGLVHGGHQEKTKQTSIMDRRDWVTVDEVAKQVEADVRKLMAKTTLAFLVSWLQQNGITATGTQ